MAKRHKKQIHHKAHHTHKHGYAHKHHSELWLVVGVFAVIFVVLYMITQMDTSNMMMTDYGVGTAP